MVQEYLRPSTLEEALEAKTRNPAAAFLAGGTFLLSGDYREKPHSVIDLGPILPRAVERRGRKLSIGAGASFQDLADSALVPAVLKTAVLSMVNRNVRNRASVGGNLAAGKSCASLLPLALALEARVSVARREASGMKTQSLPVEAWLADPTGILLGLEFEIPEGRRAAFGRYARTSCDLSVLTVGLAYHLENGKIQGLRVAMGGLGPRARRFPDIEALFENSPFTAPSSPSAPSPSSTMAMAAADIEAAVLPLLSPRADWRGSAGFKKIRAACLLADALHHAEEVL